MKHQRIDDKARVWLVTRDDDGRLQDELDPQFLSSLGTAHSAEEVANVLINAAGEIEMAETRLW
jgi:hypothetical protein